MKTKRLKIGDLEGRPRHEQVQIMSEAMRAIDPATDTAVRASLRCPIPCANAGNKAAQRGA